MLAGKEAEAKSYRAFAERCKALGLSAGDPRVFDSMDLQLIPSELLDKDGVFNPQRKLRSANNLSGVEGVERSLNTGLVDLSRESMEADGVG